MSALLVVGRRELLRLVKAETMGCGEGAWLGHITQMAFSDTHMQKRSLSALFFGLAIRPSAPRLMCQVLERRGLARATLWNPDHSR